MLNYVTHLGGGKEKVTVRYPRGPGEPKSALSNCKLLLFNPLTRNLTYVVALFLLYVTVSGGRKGGH